MKRTGIIILAVLYMAVSSGVIVNMHYCMNRFASADLGFASAKKECGKCGMHKEESHGCCHDEVKLVKLQDDQNKTMQSVFDFAATGKISFVPSLFIAASFYNHNTTGEYPDHSPPLSTAYCVYLENCVFRI